MISYFRNFSIHVSHLSIVSPSIPQGSVLQQALRGENECSIMGSLHGQTLEEWGCKILSCQLFGAGWVRLYGDVSFVLPPPPLHLNERTCVSHSLVQHWASRKEDVAKSTHPLVCRRFVTHTDCAWRKWQMRRATPRCKLLQCDDYFWVADFRIR